MYVRIYMFVSIKRTEQNSKIQLKRIFNMKLELGLNTKLFPSCHKKSGKVEEVRKITYIATDKGEIESVLEKGVHASESHAKVTLSHIL